MSLAPGTNLGSYRILSLLGKGGMGEVYRAEDPKLGREVAIKVLPEGFAEDQERLKRFEREARAASALNHPNILTIYELGLSDGRPFLVMELLDGCTLLVLMAEGPMTPERVAGLAEQVAAGLAAAHERGIVHRDLKPENIFVTRDRVVKLLDFGLAKQGIQASEGSLASTQGVTAAGTVVGTVAYMSPEQACGRSVDFRSDQFSLGVVMYEMVTGRRPFAGDSAMETLAAIVRDEPMPWVGPGGAGGDRLAKIVFRCLAKDPGDRYPSTKDLVRALGGQGVRPSRKRRSPVPGWWFLAGVVLVAGLGLGGLLAWGRRSASTNPDRRSSTRLVALPARVLGSPDSAFLGEAVPDTLSTLLAGTRGLDLKTPPSAKALAEANGDLRTVSRAYGVDQLVTSTVTAQGEMLVLNVQLVDAASQAVSWAAQFQGSRGAYNDLLHQAADALAGHFQVERGGRGADSPVSSEVELALGEARYFTRLYGEEKHPAHFTHSSAAYGRVLAMDPRNTAAMAGLGLLWRARFIHTGEAPAIPVAEDWARRALRLDPGCAWAWFVLAWTSADQHRLEEAIEYSIRAAHLSPGTAQFHTGIGNSVSDPGSDRIYLAAIQEATRMEPLRADTGVFLVDGLVRSRRPEEALQAADRYLAIRADIHWLNLARARALAELGRVEEAEAVLARWRGRMPTASPWVREYWAQVQLLCQLERLPRAEAQARARALVRRYQASSPDQYSLVFGMEILVPPMIRLGLREEALDLMEQKTQVGGPPNLDWLYEDPDLRRLHGEPRLTRLLLQARASVLPILGCFDRAKARGELPAYLEPAVEDLRKLTNQPVPDGS